MEKLTCWICGHEISNDSKFICDNCGEPFHKGCINKMSYCINCGMPTVQSRATSHAIKNTNSESNIKNTQQTQIQNTNYSLNTQNNKPSHDTGFIYGMNILNDNRENRNPYSNIGGKIKGLAKTIAIGGLILGIILFFISIGFEEDAWWVGLIIGIVTAVIYWISSFTLYGYGELITASDEQTKILTKILQELKNSKKG